LFRVAIPPLRERGDDILKLAETLLDRLQRKHRLCNKTIDPDGRKRLLNYPWPGNVRELSHELERGLVFEEGDALRFEHLHPPERLTQPATSFDDRDWFNERYIFVQEGGFLLEEAINRLIQHALKQTHNNVSGAARLLGVSRDYVRYRLSGQKASPGPGEAPQGTSNP
jgi:DNA-binding NtrC family response regulator